MDSISMPRTLEFEWPCPECGKTVWVRYLDSGVTREDLAKQFWGELCTECRASEHAQHMLEVAERYKAITGEDLVL